MRKPESKHYRCGPGQSLKYMGEKGASELWGIDISKEQIEKADQLLQSCGYSPRLICMPMEGEGNRIEITI